MTWLSRLWTGWVRVWDHREVPTVLALVRLLAGAVLLYDVLQIGLLDLVVPLMGPREIGGFGATGQADKAFLWHLLPWTPTTAWALWGLWVLALLGVTTGTLTPVACLTAALIAANQAALVNDADRGIDLLYRNVFWILAFAPSGRALSVDARWRTGSWLGDDQLRPAWGRHLLLLQLVFMYTVAGIAKVGARWMPFADFSALWVILHDPAVARFEPPPPEVAYPLTQLGTAVTMMWEWTTPLLVVVFLGRHLGERAPAWLRRVVAWRPEFGWVGVGAVFHLGIAVLMDLGIFPWAMLALYPAFLHPDDLRRLVARLRPAAR